MHVILLKYQISDNKEQIFAYLWGLLDVRSVSSPQISEQVPKTAKWAIAALTSNYVKIKCASHTKITSHTTKLSRDSVPTLQLHLNSNDWWVLFRCGFNFSAANLESTEIKRTVPHGGRRSPGGLWGVRTLPLHKTLKRYLQLHKKTTQTLLIL